MFSRKNPAVNQRDPRRAALAEAIAERDDIDRRLETARAAAERLASAVSDAAARISAAQASATASHEERLDRLIAGGTEVIERPVRTALRDAEDDVVEAKQALAKVGALISQHEDARVWVERRLKDAVGEITSRKIGSVIADVERLRDALDGRFAILRIPGASRARRV